jgi:hypothetical protein
MADIAGLIPPRVLFVESSTNDGIVPIAAIRASVVDARRIFEQFAVRGSWGSRRSRAQISSGQEGFQHTAGSRTYA